MAEAHPSLGVVVKDLLPVVGRAEAHPIAVGRIRPAGVSDHRHIERGCEFPHLLHGRFQRLSELFLRGRPGTGERIELAILERRESHGWIKLYPECGAIGEVAVGGFPDAPITVGDPPGIKRQICQEPSLEDLRESGHNLELIVKVTRGFLGEAERIVVIDERRCNHLDRATIAAVILQEVVHVLEAIRVERMDEPEDGRERVVGEPLLVLDLAQ